MNELNQSIQAIPQATLIASLMLVVIGLILWAAGRRVLKPAFASIALLAGAGAGWYLGNLDFDIGVPAFYSAIIAALLFMCFAIIAYRALVATGMALVLAIGAPLCLWGGAELRSGDQSNQSTSSEVTLNDQEPAASEPTRTDLMPELEDIDPWWERGDSENVISDADQVDDQTEDDPQVVEATESSMGEELKSMTNQLARDMALSDDTEQHIEKASSYVRAVSDWGKSMLAKTPPALQGSMLLAGIIGAITGILVGTIAGSFSTAIVTAFGGSLLWLMSSVVVARELSLSQNLYTELAPGTWLLGWVCLSIIGLAIQWTFRPSKADNVG